MQHHSSEVEQVGSTCFSQCSWRCSISQTFVIRGNQWSSLVLHKEGSKRSFESCSPFSKRLKQERRWASKQMSQYFALAFSPENMALQVTLCWRARKFALQMPNCHNCHGSSLTSSLRDPAYKSCSFPPESNFNHQTDLKHPNLSDDLSHRLRYVVVMAFLAYLLVMDFTKIGPGQRLTRISLLTILSWKSVTQRFAQITQIKKTLEFTLWIVKSSFSHRPAKWWGCCDLGFCANCFASVVNVPFLSVLQSYSMVTYLSNHYMLYRCIRHECPLKSLKWKKTSTWRSVSASCQSSRASGLGSCSLK